jgi:serine/threonine protein kinase
MSDNTTPEQNENADFVTEVTMVDAGVPASGAPRATEVTMVDDAAGVSDGTVPVATELISKTQAESRAGGSSRGGGDLQPGDRLDRYVIVRKLGQGGMGSVYLVRHETLGVFRAVKVLSGALFARGGEFVNRFIQEAKIACAISHPNIVNVLDVGQDAGNGMCYIIMEYVDGGTVRDVLRSAKRFSEPHAVLIVSAVAEALQAAAAQKIVHRDIKPDNIMLTRRGEVKLADLGIAKNNEEDVQLTRSHVMMGTPAYLAPEQARDAHSVDVRADIYSLGATFYEMLTGEIPYPGKSTYDILAKLMSSPVPDPRALAPNLSPQTAKLVMRMLAKEAKQRPATPAALLKDIRSLNLLPQDLDTQQSIRELLEQSGAGKYSVLSGTSVTAKPVSPWLARRKLLLIASGAAAVVLIIGIPLALHFSAGGGPAAKMNTPIAAPESVRPGAPAPQPGGTDQAAPVKQDAANVPPQVSEAVSGETAETKSDGAAVKPESTSEVKPQTTEAKVPAPEVKPQTTEAKVPASEVKPQTAEAKVPAPEIKPAETAKAETPAAKVNPEPAPQAVKPAVAAKLPVSAEISPIGARALLRSSGGVAFRDEIVPSDGKIRFELPAGRYKLLVSSPGYKSVERAFSVSKNRPVAGIKIALEQEVCRCVITVYGRPKLLDFVRKQGLGLKIDDQPWIKLTAFPHELDLPRKVHSLELRGDGIRSISKTVRIAPDQTRCPIEFFLSAQEPHLELSTTIPDPVQINITGIWEPMNSIVKLTPFRTYTLRWRIGGEEQDPIKIAELPPGGVRQFKLERRRLLALPGAEEFAEAEKLAGDGNYREAAEKYAAAAEKGHPEANYQLGRFAEEGKGRWFSSDSDALALYRKAAEAPANNPRAQYRVGLFCEEGRGGESRDFKKALEWYAKAAERKNPEAMYRLGMAYKNGEGGLPVDYPKTISLLTAAALSGHPDAQYELGFCYENGVGVPINVAQAKAWYAKSSAQGNEKAARRGKVLDDIK